MVMGGGGAKHQLTAQQMFAVIIIIILWQFEPLEISQIPSLLSIMVGTSFIQVLINSQLHQHPQVFLIGPPAFILNLLQYTLHLQSESSL